jgi:hypothetical protein
MGQLYGYSIDTDVELERARAGIGPLGAIEVRRTDEPLLWRPGELLVCVGRVWAIARVAEGLAVVCAASGEWILDHERGRILSRPGASTSVAWEHRLGSSIVPLLLAERGELALHAAVIGVGDRAFAFCGVSGAGKSTLAGALARAGHPVLGEDGVVARVAAGGVSVWPGQRGTRPRGPDGTDFDRPAIGLDGPDPGAGPQTLGAVVVLEPRGGHEPVVESLDGPLGLAGVMGHAVYAGRSGRARAYAAAAAVARTVPVLRARIPDDLAAIDAHAATLISCTRALAAPHGGQTPPVSGAQHV